MGWIPFVKTCKRRLANQWGAGVPPAFPDESQNPKPQNIFDHFKVRLEYTSLLNHLRAGSEQHAQLVQEEIKRHKKQCYV